MDDPHVETSLTGELFPNVPRGLLVGLEGSLQDFQLFRLDGGSGASPFTGRSANLGG